MSNFILSCCSTVDLTKEYLAKRSINCIYFNYELDGVAFKDDFGASNSSHEIFERMLKGADAKTSCVSTGAYIQSWTPFLEEGKDIVHVCLSSAISGTYNAACTAQEELQQRFPARRIEVIDSLNASAGFGLLVDKLADLRDEGKGAEEVSAWAQKNRLNIQAWFFTSDLRFFIKGGRVSKTAGAIGGLLKICPILAISQTGALEVVEKVRTKNRAIKRLVDIMKATIPNPQEMSGKVFLSNSDCETDALELTSQIQNAFPSLEPSSIQNFEIGATIGCHTGPGTVAVFYWGKEREVSSKQ